MSLSDINFSNYPIAGVASMGATVLTNPLEVSYFYNSLLSNTIIVILNMRLRFKVIKTRLQLQGELQKQNVHIKVYRGVLHAFYQVAKHDGIYGLQKGLVPAFGFQFCLNSLR